nr:MAG TPA: hypothetical protein [Caudoviricetes sp.]
MPQNKERCQWQRSFLTYFLSTFRKNVDKMWTKSSFRPISHSVL